jgi:hypothetical protein
MSKICMEGRLFTRHSIDKTYFTRNYQPLTRGSKRSLLQLPKVIDIYEDNNLGDYFELRRGSPRLLTRSSGLGTRGSALIEVQFPCYLKVYKPF